MRAVAVLVQLQLLPVPLFSSLGTSTLNIIFAIRFIGPFLKTMVNGNIRVGAIISFEIFMIEIVPVPVYCEILQHCLQ
jgi:hypothetical protein